jgi:DNA primase large subunit
MALKLSAFLPRREQKATASLQQRLGIYTTADEDALNEALDGFPLSELRLVCFDRVDALCSITDGKAIDTSPATPDASRVQTDKVSFLILAYGCCMNQAQWFVRNEARRLMSMVDSLTSSEKVELLCLLQVDVQLMPDVSFYAVDFEHVTQLVVSRQVTLHKGTAYVDEWQLRFVIRQAYEAQLKTFVRQCKIRLEQIGRTNTAYYAPQFATIINIMHDVQFRVCPVVPCDTCSLNFTAQTLPVAIARFAPLCIVRLAIRLRFRGHLVDKERLTLRLWLCAVKVKLDVAVDFWQARVSEKEDVLAPMALVYGKQYACIGCPKIRGLGLCPFQATEKAILGWCSETMPSAVGDIEDILVKNKSPSERCCRVFALRHSRHLSERLYIPSNPASYFLRATDAGLE